MREGWGHDGRTVLIFLSLGPLVGLACLGLVSQGIAGVLTVPLAVLAMAVYATMLGGGRLALLLMLVAIAVPELPGMLAYLVVRRFFPWRVAAAAAAVAAAAAWIVAFAAFAVDRIPSYASLPSLPLASGLAALICCWIDRRVRCLRQSDASPPHAPAPAAASAGQPD